MFSIALLGLAQFVAPIDRIVPYKDQAPSPVRVPNPPTRKASADDAAPHSATLERDGAIAARFTAEGQSVVFQFDCREGEVSLFELEGYGYSRGWAATAGIRILSPFGTVLAEVVRPGGMTFTNFVSFRAPTPGTYRYELTALKESFRFSLVRHSGFLEPGAEEIAHIGKRNVAYGYLATSQDTRRFAIELEPGERVRVRVVSLRERHSNRLLGKRAQMLTHFLSDELIAEYLDLDGLLVKARANAARHGQLLPHYYPFHELRLLCDGSEVASAGSLLMYSAEQKAIHTIEVSAHGDSEGGIFTLSVEREPQLHAVTGRVGDLDDDPLEGVTLRFLVEPDLETMAEVKTRADGSYAAHLPIGNYSVIMFRNLNTRIERVRTRVEHALELNLLCSVPEDA